jgi:hypothetical protein
MLPPLMKSGCRPTPAVCRYGDPAWPPRTHSSIRIYADFVFGFLGFCRDAVAGRSPGWESRNVPIFLDL